MAYTQADLEKVEKAIAKGALTVRDSDGKSITYRSMDELKSARDIIKKALSTVKRPRSFIARTSKGV